MVANPEKGPENPHKKAKTTHVEYKNLKKKKKKNNDTLNQIYISNRLIIFSQQLKVMKTNPITFILIF